jgi:hypothetical protein
VRELIGCAAFGVILGLLLRPRRARITGPLISDDEVGPTIIVVVLSLAVSFGAYLWITRRERD